jgi:hypothetical protein
LWKPLQGAIYKLHSGIVADRTPPTSTDRRLTIIVDGKAAKDIFNSLANKATGCGIRRAFIAAIPHRTSRRKRAHIVVGSDSIFALVTALEP